MSWQWSVRSQGTTFLGLRSHQRWTPFSWITLTEKKRPKGPVDRVTRNVKVGVWFKVLQFSTRVLFAFPTRIYVMWKSDIHLSELLSGFTSSAWSTKPAEFKYSWGCFGVRVCVCVCMYEALLGSVFSGYVSNLQLAHINTHMGIHDLSSKGTYSGNMHTHSRSPSCNKWRPDCVWWWRWCKRTGMLVAMADELCWINVVCAPLCVCVCEKRSTLIHVPWAIKQLSVSSQSQAAGWGWRMFSSFFFCFPSSCLFTLHKYEHTMQLFKKFHPGLICLFICFGSEWKYSALLMSHREGWTSQPLEFFFHRTPA